MLLDALNMLNNVEYVEYVGKCEPRGSTRVAALRGCITFDLVTSENRFVKTDIIIHLMMMNCWCRTPFITAAAATLTYFSRYDDTNTHRISIQCIDQPINPLAIPKLTLLSLLVTLIESYVGIVSVMFDFFLIFLIFFFFLGSWLSTKCCRGVAAGVAVVQQRLINGESFESRGKARARWPLTPAAWGCWRRCALLPAFSSWNISLLLLFIYLFYFYFYFFFFIIILSFIGKHGAISFACCPHFPRLCSTSTELFDSAFDKCVQVVPNREWMDGLWWTSRRRCVGRCWWMWFHFNRWSSRW